MKNVCELKNRCIFVCIKKQHLKIPIMKIIIVSLIVLTSLTSCVKKSEFKNQPYETVNVKPADKYYISINDTLYDNPEAYALVHGGKLFTTVIK